jgi:hypothetical protein
MGLPFDADVVNGNDVGVMAELGHRLGFAVEALDRLLRGILPGDEDLQGDGAVQLRVEGLVDDAHAPAADLLEDLVRAEGLLRS